MIERRRFLETLSAVALMGLRLPDGRYGYVSVKIARLHGWSPALVRLDGVDVSLDCLELDDRAGYVVLMSRDEHGRAYLDAHQHVVREVRYGSVVFTPRCLPSDADERIALMPMDADSPQSRCIPTMHMHSRAGRGEWIRQVVDGGPPAWFAHEKSISKTLSFQKLEGWGSGKMPHDIHGKELRVDDLVAVRCRVKEIYLGEEFCNVTLETVEPMFRGKQEPDDARRDEPRKSRRKWGERAAADGVSGPGGS